MAIRLPHNKESKVTPTEPHDKLPVKRSLIPSDASEEIDLMNNALNQKLRKQSDQTPTETCERRDKLLVQRSLILSDA
ncbi:hypothetical protein DPMN_067640 [Dreissena polymorpha]|uniref:Uncharacterized protein n=1 Tax=Dreissena polymorpha TaxID=45954 RepID=A0A9D4BTM0_DREPO|nr:hypothetical protein DPMN_067640 [Dreissena polymorpha]